VHSKDDISQLIYYTETKKVERRKIEKIKTDMLRSNSNNFLVFNPRDLYYLGY